MSNDRLEPFNYHNIAFKRCADVVSLERLDRLWFFRHHWFVKIGWFGKCWTDLLAFWGVWNRSRILNFGPDRLFFRFSRALVYSLGISEDPPRYLSSKFDASVRSDCWDISIWKTLMQCDGNGNANANVDDRGDYNSSPCTSYRRAKKEKYYQRFEFSYL